LSRQNRYRENILLLLKSVVQFAVQKLANDPEARAKVARVVKEEIVPQAKQGWEQAKPELENIKAQLKQDWEQAKPQREKVIEKVRDLAKKQKN